MKRIVSGLLQVGFFCALGAGCTSQNPSVADLAVVDGPLFDLGVASDGATLDLTLAGDGALAGVRYDVDGTGAYTTFDAAVSGDGHSFTVRGYLPSAAGAHPVVVLGAGLQQPAAAYASYGKRLASYGIVVLLRDDPGFLVATPQVASDVEYLVTTWLPAANASGTLAGKLDLAQVGLAGHSRGGKATLLAAEGAAKTHVKAWLGLDPVDASPTAAEPKARTTIANVGVPLLFVGAGVTTTCSPATDNYQVLFDASVAPSVAVTLVGASHAQVEDATACFACGLCTPAGTADQAAVLALALRYTTAFFARELLGDTSVGAQLDGAGAAADLAAGTLTRQAK